MKTLDLAPATLARDFLAALADSLLADGFWSAPFAIGVSGGADSVALLLGVCEISRRQTRGHKLFVVHAEHDMRENAGVDRKFVAALADRMGLPFLWRKLPLCDAAATRSQGLEGRARQLRYAFFADAARDTGGRHVAVAHTADDQSETILHRALRGTGLAGLGGMPKTRKLCTGVALVRPLLNVSRATVRGYLAARDQQWCEDQTNQDTHYARNFLRHEILPRCEAGPYPAATRSLERLGQQASVVAAAIRSAAEHLLQVYASRQADGSVVLRTDCLASLDPHLIAEIFVALWQREDWPQRDMTARHYASLAAMALASAHDSPRLCPVTPQGKSSDFPCGEQAIMNGNSMMALTRHQ